MKKILLSLCALVIAMGCTLTSSAQSSKDSKKERQELRKETTKELNKKSTKAAQKEAKQLKKDGWKSAPGALPMDKQLDRAYMMQYELDEDLAPKYLMGEAMSVGGNYDAAKMQALELAKQNLAGQIQTEVTALIENTVANDQLSAGEAESLTRTVSASKNLITQSIGRTVPVVEVYRTLDNGNKEVLVRLAYNYETALKSAKKAVRQELEKRGDELHGKLDELLGW